MSAVAARALLRAATLLCLAAAAVTLAALSGEYPGRSAAGQRVAARDVLPLAAVPWLHLGVLHADAAHARRWAAAAVAADALLLARALPHARPGAPPLALALPAIAVLLAAGALAVARSRARAAAA